MRAGNVMTFPVKVIRAARTQQLFFWSFTVLSLRHDDARCSASPVAAASRAHQKLLNQEPVAPLPAASRAPEPSYSGADVWVGAGRASRMREKWLAISELRIHWAAEELGTFSTVAPSRAAGHLSAQSNVSRRP